MQKLIWNNRGYINIVDDSSGQMMAVCSMSSRPVNPKNMPAESMIFIDKVAFDRMCMDYVRNKGEAALIATAEQKPNKDAALLTLTAAALAAGWAVEDALRMAKEAYEELEKR